MLIIKLLIGYDDDDDRCEYFSVFDDLRIIGFLQYCNRFRDVSAEYEYHHPRDKYPRNYLPQKIKKPQVQKFHCGVKKNKFK